MHKCEGRLCTVSFGLALGIVWGVGVFLTAIGACFFDWGGAFVDVLASVYVGYAATLLGGFIGLLWGFVDGFICGFIFAWLYNYCRTCCAKKCAKQAESGGK